MTRSLRLLIFTWSVLMALVVAAFGCSSEPTLSAIDVTPATVSIAKGATQQFKATGKYSDDSIKDLTNQVSWSSSDEAVAMVDAKGLGMGMAKGEATISAGFTDGDAKITGKATLSVTDADVTLTAIAITPATPAVAKGTMMDLVATGTYSDGTTKDVTGEAAWTTSDDAVATVDAGVVMGVDGGTATIGAAIGDVKGEVDLTVTMATLTGVEVDSPVGWLAKGLTQQLTATGVFSDESRQDLTKQVVWGSSGPAVEVSNSIGSKGLATAMNEGAATITATLMNVTGSVQLVVTSATLQTIEVTPFDPTIADGTEIALTATGILSDHSVLDLTPFVDWVSSDEKVAKLSGEALQAGVASAVGVGQATISAKYMSLSGSTTLTVSSATLSKLNLVPLNPTIAKGTSLRFLAIGTFSDDTAQDLTSLAMWGSSNLEVAAVSNLAWTRGLATALAEGTTTVTATIGGKSDSTTLTVSKATLAAIAVTPSYPSIAKGTSLQMVATGIYTDKTTQDLTAAAAWDSTDADIVAVSNAAESVGVATGVAEGSAGVKATFGGVTGVMTVKVSSATLQSIEVTPPNPSIAKGTTVQLKATGVYSDKTTQDLTSWVAWSSSDASVAVSNALETHGLAVGQVQGSADITATFMGGVAGKTRVTVTAATLVSLAVAPEDPSIAKGTRVQLHAIGTYSDNAKQELTYLCSWISDSPNVSLSGFWWSKGLVTGVHEGSATVTAHCGGESADTTVTVTAATLTQMAISPANASLAKGTATWLTVTGTYTDGATQDLSDLVTWSSSDESKVVVSNAAGAHGLATGVGVGTVTITVDFGGKSATTSLTVTAATLSAITVTPANATVAKNGTKQLQAIGTFTDDSMQNITTLVIWSTSDPAKAIVSNAIGSKGLVTGVDAGAVTISATLAGKSGATQVTVQ